MNKSVAYLVVFFGSLTSIIVSCAILTPNAAGAVAFVTLLLGVFVLIAISST